MTEGKTATEEAAQLSQNPLFQQIAALMTGATAAKQLLDFVVSIPAGEATQQQNDEVNRKLVNLAHHLAMIDFDHGNDIVAGALQACEMARPDIDIICSGCIVGMPQKSKNQEKMLFIKGNIAGSKGAIILLDKDKAEHVVMAINNCLDILHPGRVVGAFTPKLITELNG